METIRKTTKRATYFEGSFKLRDNSTVNWATPINFPTVFEAFGAGMRSGNWRSCTAINTPQFVINEYFDGTEIPSHSFWDSVFVLENITWDDVKNDKDRVLSLINNANNELLKLEVL